MIRRAGAIVALAGLLSVIAGGCNVITTGVFLAQGVPRIDAQYVLPDRPTVVYVDDRNGVIGMRQREVRRTIADKVGDDLMRQGVITQRVNARDAIALVQTEDSHSSLMSVEEIGDAVGAEVVIYIEVFAMQLSPDGSTPRPVGSCRVRVIDARNKERLFPPAEQDARVIQVSLREVSVEAYRTQSARLKIYQDLAEEMGSQVAKLFYEHDYKELGGNLKPR